MESDKKLEEIGATANTAKQTKTIDGDTDLSELLDDCLADFDKPIEDLIGKDQDEATSQIEAAKEELKPPAFDEFENEIKKFLEANNLQADYEKMASTFDNAGNFNPEDLLGTLAETMKGLADNKANVDAFPNQPTEEELAKLFSMANMGEAQGSLAEASVSNLMPIMQNVMKNLLSKDILYPAVRDLVKKYPDWLKENESKLSPQELGQYTMQLKLMKDVQLEFEEEKPEDSETMKTKRFEKLLFLMQKMQECGHPPPELIGTEGSPFDFGEDSLPNLQGDKCSLM